jgi:hypothetical protein
MSVAILQRGQQEKGVRPTHMNCRQVMVLLIA